MSQRQSSVLGPDAPMQLERVIFYGRHWTEYEAMFDIRLSDLSGKRVLDCPGGPASFTAFASAAGAMVTAIDPLYKHSDAELAGIAAADMQTAHRQAMNIPRDRFRWDFFPDPFAFLQAREAAVNGFLQDFADNRHRYVPAVTPELPFAPNTFDLVLSGFLHFTYLNDFNFHFRSIAAMVEVAKPGSEVRIFPDRDMNGRDLPFMEQLLDELLSVGIQHERRPTNYRVLQGLETYCAFWAS